MICLADDTVLGLVEGRVQLLGAVEEHLDSCDSCRDVVAQVARAQVPGRVGRYVVGELLGAGAMGRVYSAWEPHLDRRVALKLLLAPGLDARARVVREAQAMAKLDHPNVIGVHEAGTSDDGVVYVAMDLVEGETLRAWSRATRSWREAVPVLVEVARGLAAVHAAGVVHRDVKPDNVIVGADGRTRLGDFGAASTGEALGGTAGTPAYMAPEVLRGDPATRASDQWSFGVLAYELLAGARPFGGASWDGLRAAIEAGPPPAIRAAPAWIDAAIVRCLAIDPAERWSDLTAFADHVAARASRRRPTTWLVAAGAAAALASGATWLATHHAPAAPSCDVGAAELAVVWSSPVRARLAPLGASAIAGLDAWAARWADERDATCRIGPTQAPALVAARERCLETRRAELGAIVDRLSRAEPMPLSPGGSSSVTAGATAGGLDVRLGDHVVDALASLPPPAECRDARPGAADPMPLDPTAAAAAREVEDKLPGVRAAIALGDARPVTGVVAELVTRARASGHAPTIGEAMLVDAEAMRATSQLGEAITAAREAVAAAERGHDDLLAARAWTVRVALAGDRRDLTAADDAGVLAAAAIDRAGAPPQLVATNLRQRGLVAYNRGALDEAKRLLTDARERFVAIGGKDSLDVATTESALGSVARAAGDLDTAEAWHESAYATDRALRNPLHPDLARDLHNIAGVLRLRGKLEDATASYRAALAIEEAARGPDSVEAGLTHNSLGLVAMAQHDGPRARTELTRARDILTAAGHGDRAFAEHNLGLVELAAGNRAAALAHFDVAAAIYRDTIGERADAAVRLVDDRRAAAALPSPLPSPRAPIAANVVAPPPVVAPDPPPPSITPPAAPSPANPPPKRDVGVYGSTQTW